MFTEINGVRLDGESLMSRPKSPETLTSVDQLDKIRGLDEARLAEGRYVQKQFPFRVPRFYLEHVLNGSVDDPLFELVMPSRAELEDGPELWDATPSPYSLSSNPFWIQKYEFQGLIRLTSVCSGLCRFCYLKDKARHSYRMTPSDVHSLFADLRPRASTLREIILSGGDPLCAPSATLLAIAEEMHKIRQELGDAAPAITIHTREPVWNPVELMRKNAVLSALATLQPNVYMINVLHPREVTPEFQAAVSALSDLCPTSRPAFLAQHPVFRGVNDSVETLMSLYVKLQKTSPPVLPYYMVHPFYNGTLPQHRLKIEETQALYRELLRRPGCLVPRLVVPTPQGKCVIGPNEPITVDKNGNYTLLTKDGVEVQMS